VGARAAFKFPLCCCESVDRPDRKSGYDFTFSIPEFRTIGISEAHTCPRMAQNVNPFSSTQNTPPKATEGKQPMPKDNHAVSKRYEKYGFIKIADENCRVGCFVSVAERADWANEP